MFTNVLIYIIYSCFKIVKIESLERQHAEMPCEVVFFNTFHNLQNDTVKRKLLISTIILNTRMQLSNASYRASEAASRIRDELMAHSC